MADFIDTLFAVIQDRQVNPVAASYTNQLLEQGLSAITQKVGEEAVEVLVAAHSQTDARLVEEFADLVYHSLVLLAYKGLTPDDIRAELRRRHE
jgi:phosphoribosyl-ATP pyrophosphohydrolase